jgi:hypothetical protein
MSSDNYLNAAQAATQSGVSVVTIRNHLAKGSFPNAKKTLKGKIKVWAIPLTDLAAAGLLDKVSNASEAQTKEAELIALKSRLTSVENQLAVTQELLAEVRGERDHLRTLTRPQLETRDTQEQRRRWFGRNR